MGWCSGVNSGVCPQYKCLGGTKYVARKARYVEKWLAEKSGG